MLPHARAQLLKLTKNGPETEALGIIVSGQWRVKLRRLCVSEAEAAWLRRMQESKEVGWAQEDEVFKVIPGYFLSSSPGYLSP